MRGTTRRLPLIRVMVTRHFDEKDAEAIVYELHGVTEQPATEPTSAAS